ncbi:MAG TPA: ATP-dependent helicase HrpB [Stellaceae bacterium]|nr:ATP-dependent helicase HrpB [Stellaceae bacterium]
MRPFDLMAWAEHLPAAETVPALRDALDRKGVALLQAPPGSGKTTLVPLALLGERWLGERRIVMLEPRRLAARAAARRMASMLSEAVGATVGYRTRLDSRIGTSTRIEVVTEGILIRQLQEDPSLEGTGLLIFDEFHERSLDGDLGLALALESRRALRPELRLLVMSATLDIAAVAELMGGAPVISGEGRRFSVDLRYLDRPAPEQLEAAVVAAVRGALGRERGSLLVFLPGLREIRRVERRLAEIDLASDVLVAPLYGDLAPAAQDAAIAPAPPGRRKIVLATSIAETSLTIEGVRVVIDSGLARRPRFDPRTGMTRLVTSRVSQAAAEQRRGRAGRIEPGICYRLWPEQEQTALAAHTQPEVMDADLAPLALELACWGARDPLALAWLDPPPAAAFAQAMTLLRELGAVDAAGGVTAHGRDMGALGFHPRLVHMMLRARESDTAPTAAAIAAVLSERDVIRARPGARDSDLRLRLEMLQEGVGRHSLPPGLALDRGAIERARDLQRQWCRSLGVRVEPIEPSAAGRVLALAYPDRLAQRRSGIIGSFRLANGAGAALAAGDPLANEEFLAVAELDGDPRNARIFLAAPVTRAEIEQDFADAIERVDLIAWDEREEAVLARHQERLRALVLSDAPLRDPPQEHVRAALIAALRNRGVIALPWSEAAIQLRNRVRFVRTLPGESERWPDITDTALIDRLDEWLGPVVTGITRLGQITPFHLDQGLAAMLSFEQRRRLDELAPTHVTVPSGSRVPIDYGAGDVPVLAVRLQELFGLAETPAIARESVPLLLHLLSPAGRPLQVTRDLRGFWRSSYRQVRSEMRGRYPKHPWPDDPLTAPPTRRTKRRSR